MGLEIKYISLQWFFVKFVFGRCVKFTLLGEKVNWDWDVLVGCGKVKLSLVHCGFSGYDGGNW